MRQIAIAIAFCMVAACAGRDVRGIADKRSDFKQFLPMKGDAAHYGLRTVKPFFPRANRAEIMRAIENACRDTRKRGSSVYNEERQAGYYVNCNPQNRQLLNGYVPATSREAPRS